MTAAVLTGFLGGYTTFSSMQLDTAALSKSSGREALLYLIGSVAAGLVFAALGVWLAKLGQGV